MTTATPAKEPGEDQRGPLPLHPPANFTGPRRAFLTWCSSFCHDVRTRTNARVADIQTNENNFVAPKHPKRNC